MIGQYCDYPRYAAFLEPYSLLMNDTGEEGYKCLRYESRAVQKVSSSIMSMLTLFQAQFCVCALCQRCGCIDNSKWLSHKKAETTLGIYASLVQQHDKVDVAIQPAFAIPKAIGD